MLLNAARARMITEAMNCSRFFSLAGWLCLAGMSLGAADVSSAGEPRAGAPVAPAYPLWDGKETVAQYARRVNLPETKTLDLGNGVSLDLVLIPAGKFIMGTSEPESPWIGGTILGIAGLLVLILAAQVLIRAVRRHRRPQFSLLWLIVVVLILGVAEYGGFRFWRAGHEPRFSFPDFSPAHAVTLTKAFYLGKFAVTQEQYAQVMGTNPSGFKGANLPVESVPWDDAQAFCRKVSEKTGQTVRLPTEAEWEFACRAGTTTAYYTEADVGQAAWNEENSNGTTHPVGQKEPNAWGLYDMHGNVWEWCQDWYGGYEAGTATDPQGPGTGTYRVLRGGSWADCPWGCGSAIRNRSSLGSRDYISGFRVVLAGPP